MSPTTPLRRRKTRRYGTSIALTRGAGWDLPAIHWTWPKMASLLMLILACAALYVMSDSYTFFVYDAKIQGNRLLASDDIYTAAHLHQQSIFWLSETRIAERIATHPYVERISVACRLPNHVTIDVTERVPRIVWISGLGELWADDEGTPLPPLAVPGPSVTLVDDETMAADADNRLSSGIAAAIFEVSKMMPEVTDFRYDSTWGLLFRAPDGWQVALGTADRMEQKLVALSDAQNDLVSRGERPELIDLRFGVPYYR
jgi:cell division septal protein FtsQ